VGSIVRGLIVEAQRKYLSLSYQKARIQRIFVVRRLHIHTS